MDIEEIERRHWDYLVIGTGIGGAGLGYALAKAGRKVLFAEKGRAPFLHGDTVRGRYPEQCFRPVEAPSARNAITLARAGRCYDEFRDGRRNFVPFIGCGTGGSSALFGMVMERFFPADFAPRRPSSDATGSALRDAWPVGYEEMAPYYRQAEDLYRVRGYRDPLRPSCNSDLLPPAPLSPTNAELYAHFQNQGLHPYRLPLACESVPGCECCQGYLCAKSCKNDAGRICLEPAVRDYGATLLDECEVVRLEATPERVTGAICRSHGNTITLRADRIILAAGALLTPALLLRSTSSHWPDGLANASGLVGRNLMRHCVDLHLVFTRETGENRFKEFGLSDFYEADGTKFGSVQSFGLLPPAAVLAAEVSKDVRDIARWASPLMRLAQPLLRPVLSRLFTRGVLLATVMEDLPYEANRIIPGTTLAIEYQLHPEGRARVHSFRQRLAGVLKPYRYISLHQAEKNAMLAHACGTCRFGADPATSVLDPFNRAHGIDNLYVVDSSFFPSSGGTNPALTIAANSIRVADHLLHHAS